MYEIPWMDYAKSPKCPGKCVWLSPSYSSKLAGGFVIFLIWYWKLGTVYNWYDTSIFKDNTCCKFPHFIRIFNYLLKVTEAEKHNLFCLWISNQNKFYSGLPRYKGLMSGEILGTVKSNKTGEVSSLLGPFYRIKSNIIVWL